MGQYKNEKLEEMFAMTSRYSRRYEMLKGNMDAQHHMRRVYRDQISKRMSHD